MSKSSTLIISFPSNVTANFLMTALPTLLTNVLFASTVEVNSMLKLRFTIPGMMTSSLLKFGNLTSSSFTWSNLTGVVSDNYFCLIPFIPLGVLREHSGFNRSPYSIFNRGLYFMVEYMKHYSYLWTISYDVIILICYSKG